MPRKCMWMLCMASSCVQLTGVADGRVEVQGYICAEATGWSGEFGLKFLEPGS